jgi:hypothetical protein
MGAEQTTFVTDGGAELTDRPLGQFYYSVGFADNNTLSCSVLLSDSNGDDPVQLSVGGNSRLLPVRRG